MKKSRRNKPSQNIQELFKKKKARFLLIFLLYLSGTIFLLKGSYDFFDSPALIEASCNADRALKSDSLNEIYGHAADIARLEVKKHVAAYHNGSNSTILPIDAYAPKEQSICLAPVNTMASGLAMLLSGILLQFLAIWMAISAKMRIK